MNRTSVVILSVLLFCQLNSINAKINPFSYGGTYTGDAVNNFHGGIKKGFAYLGMATLNGDFDTEKAGWWKGGEAYIKIANTHGGEPTTYLVGDFQGVSNIEAGNLTWLYEFWYKQQFSKWSVVIGVQDLNVNFATTENGTLFTNSSFGIHSSIADNIPSPIFPLTALGISMQWKVSDNLIFQAALFDGTPDDFENNPFNISWRLNKTDGFLTLSEFHLSKSLIKNLNGSFKLGGYYHMHGDLNVGVQKNFGLYGVAEQEITDKFSLFAQIGLSPRSINNHNHFYSLGFNLKTPFKKRENDVFGMAIAYAGIDSNEIGSETAIELTYQLNIYNILYVRPDIQYIINPAGTDQKLDNALVGFLRFGVEF